jgi:trimethylamine--corrinoid protein Co-methyltransferase
MKYVCGSVEMGLLNAAGAQMASYYGLPYYATAGATDSKVVDAQSAYESAITAVAAGLAGAHFIHDAAGLMEFAMTVSLEKYVIDNEILGMVSRAIRGIEVNPETLAFDTIRDVGPGGNYISRKHTVRYMRSEHYMPRLSDRLDRVDWEGEGSLDATERAHLEVRRILQSESKQYVSMETQDRVKAMFPEISI